MTKSLLNVLCLYVTSKTNKMTTMKMTLRLRCNSCHMLVLSLLHEGIHDSLKSAVHNSPCDLPFLPSYEDFKACKMKDLRMECII